MQLKKGERGEEKDFDKNERAMNFSDFLGILLDKVYQRSKEYLRVHSVEKPTG